MVFEAINYVLELGDVNELRASFALVLSGLGIADRPRSVIALGRM